MTLCFICQTYNFVFQKYLKPLELWLERLRFLGFRCILTGLRGCAGKHIRSDGVVRNSTQHFHLALRTGCVSPGQVNVYQWYARYMLGIWTAAGWLKTGKSRQPWLQVRVTPTVGTIPTGTPGAIARRLPDSQEAASEPPDSECQYPYRRDQDDWTWQIRRGPDWAVTVPCPESTWPSVGWVAAGIHLQALVVFSFSDLENI
jgi:hypothetical protein